MRTTKKDRAKTRKANHKHDRKIRSTFVSKKSASVKIKSKWGKSVSSTKIGKGNSITRIVTKLKRIIAKTGK